MDIMPDARAVGTSEGDEQLVAALAGLSPCKSYGYYRDHSYSRALENALVETTGSASIDIAASSEAVWNLLTDLTRISELSPECYKAEWEGGSTGPEVGAAFHGYNRLGGNEWDVGCVVVAADPGREWAFKVPADDGRDTVWRYVIEAADSSCTVTESFDSPILDAEHFQKMNRHQLLMKNIATTLENLKQVAEG